MYEFENKTMNPDEELVDILLDFIIVAAVSPVFAEYRGYLGKPPDSLSRRGDDRPTGNDGQTGRIRLLADDTHA